MEHAHNYPPPAPPPPHLWDKKKVGVIVGWLCVIVGWLCPDTKTRLYANPPLRKLKEISVETSRTKAEAILLFTNGSFKILCQNAYIFDCTFDILSILNQIPTWKQPYTFRGKQISKQCGSTASRSRWYTRLSPPAQIGIAAFLGRTGEVIVGLPEHC